MGAPQIIYLVMLVLSIFASACRHGTPSIGTNNFFHDMFAVGIQFAIMYWGGFFS